MNITKFDDVTRSVPLVVVGRVIAFGAAASDRLEKDDPAFIDLDILWTTKGRAPSSMRVWNDWAGTTCGGAFQSMAVGTRLVIALQRVVDLKSGRQELWDALKFRASDTDYILPKTCAETLTILKTEQDVAKWIGRSIK